MSASTAIGLVSASLRNLLIAEMRLNPAVPVTILAPDEGGGDQRINLFLYKVEENRFLKNQDWSLKSGDSSRLTPPPLSLNLYYLMTPYARNDAQTGNVTAHEILGEAMRVLYENPVITPDHLEPDLVGAREEFRIIYNDLEPEELSRLWSTFSQPFRLSVRYQVSTAQIDMLPAQERPLPKRVRAIGTPGLAAGYQPPVVHAVTPAQGTAGSTITFSGQHLAGWRATVIIADELALDSLPLTGDSFTAIIPATAKPGFYDIRVDISRLFRRTFLFEITP